MVRALVLLAALVSAQALADFIPQRADPWVLKAGGQYYFTASVPSFDKVVLRKAASLEGLIRAPEVTAWQRPAQGPLAGFVWAPELHLIDGAWYLYVAVGSQKQPFQVRTQVLENKSPDPTTGHWQVLGRMQTQWDTFNLDATQFHYQGKNYLIWAQHPPDKKYNSALYIAELTGPTSLGPQTRISEPTLPWETIGYAVNEGPAVLQSHGKVFVTFSASATDANYAMGMLWAKDGADLLDASSWHKLPKPVLTTNATLKRFGPGHNSFTQDSQGRDILVYHARYYRDLKGSPLDDPNRDARLKLITWDKNGMPDFGQDVGDYSF
ncbi:family 43 glycosylhydrolase [Gallaecimonas pentaromativorans]|uniref:GH43 family beta-xylosidase n=1 Tax=Gallaecimonas pentaromativorans TaxID=584787 RepID=A0A3N1PA48_9GAMM|nr:GH43 family beta-xylosidase [Gallaecimonas pentaromativorans]